MKLLGVLFIGFESRFMNFLVIAEKVLFELVFNRNVSRFFISLNRKRMVATIREIKF